jgi:thiamine biosynthesis protein ThiS
VTATCTVNGREHALEPGETVAGLLARLGLAGSYALVERNGEPVARSAYPKTRLESGDTVVVARPVAGG